MKDIDGYFATNHPEFIEDGRSGTYQFNENNMTNIFKVNWKDVLGAAISACLVAVLGFLVDHYTNIAFFGQHPMIAVGVLAGAASLLKAFGTTSAGKFAGVFPIK